MCSHALCIMIQGLIFRSTSCGYGRGHHAQESFHDLIRTAISSNALSQVYGLGVQGFKGLGLRVI